MNRIVAALLQCSMLLVLVVSCSTSHNPVLPSGTAPDLHFGTDYTRSANRHFLGFYEIAIDPVARTSSVVPLRTGDLHLNATRLLEVTPCDDCLELNDIMFISPNELTVGLRLTHPFPGLNKFTGFDVRGIFIAGSDYTFPDSGLKVALGEGLPRLLNPDGYTTLFNPTDFPESSPVFPALKYYSGKYAFEGDLSSTLNPYIAYQKTTARRMFHAGAAATETIHLLTSGGPFEFGYAIDASWTPVENIVDPLADFPISANSIEAYRINIEFKNKLGAYPGSTAGVEVAVYDHQGFETIEGVTIEAPEIFPGSTSLNYSAASVEPPWIFEGTVTNELGALDGDYPCLVRVSDIGVDGNLGNIDAWQIGYVSVTSELGMNSPVPIVIAVPWIAIPDQWVNFADNGSYDPDGGEVVKWEWDWENDGIFDEDGKSVYHKWDTFGTYWIGCRVTDDQSNSAELDEPLKVIVREINGWVRTWGGIGKDWAALVDVDSTGNIYAGGSYNDEVDFDPSPEGEDTSVACFDEDASLSKFDPDGNLIWSRQWGGSGHDYVHGLYIDDQDNVFVAGDTYGTVDFDPGPGVTELKGRIYLSKFDSGGNFIWARVWGDQFCSAGKLTGDVYGRVIIGGFFTDYIDLDPGSGQDLHSGYNLTGNFLSVLDSEGEYVWGQAWGDNAEGALFLFSHSLASDESGNIFFLDAFVNAKSPGFDLDPGPGQDSHVGWGTYISKFNKDGDYRWSRTWNYFSCMGAVNIHPSGNIFITGGFDKAVDLNPGPGEDIANPVGGSEDLFVIILNQNGSYIGSYTVGGFGNEHFVDTRVDSWGNMYFLGDFDGTIDLDPGPGIKEFTSEGDSSNFLLKISTWGQYLWANYWHNEAYNSSKGMEFGPNYDVYVGGWYRDGNDLFPGWETVPYLSHGETDAYLMKFPPDGMW